MPVHFIYKYLLLNLKSKDYDFRKIVIPLSNSPLPLSLSHSPSFFSFLSLSLSSILQLICWRNQILCPTKFATLDFFAVSPQCHVTEHVTLSPPLSLSWKLDPETWSNSGLMVVVFFTIQLGSLYIHWKVLIVWFSFCDINNHCWSFLGCIISLDVKLLLLHSSIFNY